MNHIDWIRSQTEFDSETQCRIWLGQVSWDGEPRAQIGCHEANIKRYLMANEYRRKGFYPIFENACQGGKLCITRRHLKLARWNPHRAKGEK
ncbi:MULTISPECIES: hypothetical protein [unclassified Streptomyces]|uniref:hypothetical protein n=1 Tax=unclassified Streptomyces TaxID=2593676 RepID=UPI0023650E86|nr:MULTISPECIES: hypothetical protein [unclassified Streptomyces]MDF3141691.1 hypothetical protein [Streptomyces sp. T21Q-yed]WDF40956.1 hypothetical protein PBV52_31345 [Streptomyces sp. T12]